MITFVVSFFSPSGLRVRLSVFCNTRLGKKICFGIIFLWLSCTDEKAETKLVPLEVIHCFRLFVNIQDNGYLQLPGSYPLECIYVEVRHPNLACVVEMDGSTLVRLY